MGSQPETLDPWNTNQIVTQAVAKSFYEGLFSFDKDLKVKSALATSYDLSADRKVYTFKLRQNVKFHDGTKFDAAAAKANFDRVMNPKNRLLRASMVSRVASVDVVDPLTLRVILKEPFAPFINTLAHPSAVMISPAAIDQYGKDIGLHPVGTGPFQFVEWKQTEAVVGKKFDGYWKSGYPKIDRITWKPVLENNTRAAMLQTGEADFVYPLPYEQASSIQKNAKFAVESIPSILVRFLAFNMLQKPFDDPRVRQAIGYAINKEALAKVAFGGFAFPARGFVPQGVKYAVASEPIPYSLQKAKELLKEAGYPNGFETTLWGGYNDTTTQKVLQFLQQQLMQVGIKVSVQALEPGQRVELVDSWANPKAAKWRLYHIAWSSSTGEADWALRPLFSTEGWTPKLGNVSFYSNQLVDESLAKALVSADESEKIALYKTAQEQLLKDLPRIPLVTLKLVWAHSKRLSGVYVMPDGSFNFEEIGVR